jgi:hypothetical protein
MLTTREQLIADWRKRLVAARDLPRSSQRAAWLARLRIRLYRLLLSLYGDGQWNSSTPSPADYDSAHSESVVIEPGALPLAGKPAKDRDQIRAALDALSGSRDLAVPPGPLTAGLTPESWVVVGSASGRLKTTRLLLFFKRSGLTARQSLRGDDRIVEVQARDFTQAQSIIEHNREALHGKERRGPLEGIHFVALIPIVTIYAPFGILALLFLADLVPHSDAERRSDFISIAILFFVGWGACIVLWCCLALLRISVLRSKTPPDPPHSPN